MTVFDAVPGFMTPDAPAGVVIATGAAGQIVREDADLPGVTGTVSPVAVGSSVLDAIESRVRWTAAEVQFDGDTLVDEVSGAVELTQSLGRSQDNSISAAAMSVGQGGTLKFRVSGPGLHGKLWGNRPVTAYLKLGKTPRAMNSVKVFTGYSYQKNDSGSTPEETDVTAVDGSIAYTGIPVCYSLPAFSGKRRGDVIREVAATVGVTVTECPLGGIVNRPVSLNNADLLTWIADFGLVENWYPVVDRDGLLRVREWGVPKNSWSLSSEKGDWDYDSFRETWPTQPACRWYLTGAKPIPLGVGSGAEPAVRVTTEEIRAPYNPRCRVNVNPSGLAYAAPRLMLVARVTTQLTTIGGDEVLRVVTTEGFYNPEAADPNMTTDPNGTDYSGAYPDKSYHLYAVEEFMRKTVEVIETTRDALGTVLSQKVTTYGWYSPKCPTKPDAAGRWTPGTWDGVTVSYPWIYADGYGHVLNVEAWMIVAISETINSYDPSDGTLRRQVTETQGWGALRSVCDIAIEYSRDGDYPGPSGDFVGHMGLFQSAKVSTGPEQATDTIVYRTQRHDWKFSASDWRADPVETFRLTSRVTVDNVVVDGQLVSTSETTEGYTNYESPMVAANLKDGYAGPPYLFGDGKWYEGYYDFWSVTQMKFTRYELFGSAGTAVTTDTVDVATGEVSLGTPLYLDGQAPLAPTLGSPLRWASVPMSIDLSFGDCAFVDSKGTADLQWAENEDDLARAGLLAAYRAAAVVREVDCAWNPAMELGDALYLTDDERGLSEALHYITDISCKSQDGAADMHITAEQWPSAEVTW